MHTIFCSSEYFEQTTNVRDFGADSLWANIGGYVGMILGFSLYHAPEVISTIFRELQTVRTKYLHKKKIKDATQIDPETAPPIVVLLKPPLNQLHKRRTFSVD